MIYQQFLRWENKVTPNRLKFAERAIARQKHEIALFADQVDWKTPEQRLDRIDTERAAWWQHMRDHHAATWRQYRRIVYSLPPAERDEILSYWSRSRVPKSSEYFATIVRNWFRERGRESELDK